MSPTSNDKDKKGRRSSSFRNNNYNDDSLVGSVTTPISMHNSQSSLRVEEDEHSIRQKRSLKPPPRTTVPIKDSHNTRISVPALANNMDSIDDYTGSSRKPSSRPQKSDNKLSSSSTTTNPSPPQQQRPRRAGRRTDKNQNNEENNTTHYQISPKTVKQQQQKPRRPAEHSSQQSNSNNNTSSLSPSSVKSRSNLSRRDVTVRSNHPGVLPTSQDEGNTTTTTTTTGEAIMAVPAISTTSPCAVYSDDGIDNRIVATTTQSSTTLTQTDSIRFEKRKARRELEGSALEEDNNVKPPAVGPGAFPVTPTGGGSVGSSTNNRHLQDDHDDMVAGDGILTAPVSVAPVAAAAATTTRPPQGQGYSHDHHHRQLPSKAAWQNTGLEDHDPKYRPNKRSSSLQSLSNNHNVGIGIPIAAELVPDQEELERRMEEQMQERLQMEVESRLEKERKKHVVAEAVQVEEGNTNVRSTGSIDNDDLSNSTGNKAPSPPKQRKYTMIMVIAAVVIGVVIVLSAIIGGVVASKKNKSEPTPTMAPTIVTTERYQEMVDTIGGMVASDPTIFFTSVDTPQYKAMDWLANNDTWATTVDRSPVLLAERYALVVLYFATDGPRWREQFSFLASTSICTWNDGSDFWASNISWDEGSGVFCGTDELVQEVWLDKTKASGNLPTELGIFSRLSGFDLGGGYLTGTLPTEVFSLQNLTAFFVYDSQGLTGSIPIEIGQATNIEALVLGGNRFDGPLPEEIYHLTLLNHLDLNRCSFSGPISPSIAKFSNLKYMDLSENSLSEYFPEEFYELTELETFSVFSNRLSGTISPNIGNFQYLEYFDYGDNSFTGPLPTELGKLEKLSSMYVENNELTGTLPSEIGSIPNLQTFSVYGNSGLVGSLPASFQNSENLVEVRVEGTNLLGVEEAFCNTDRELPIIELWADCMDEIVCTCCTACCVNGDQCTNVD